MARFLGLRGQRLGTAINGVCGLIFLCFGYAQGVMGGLLTVPAFLDRFPQVDTISNDSLHNARYQGITVATWNLGCFASAIIAIFISDALGRKKTMQLGLTIWVVGEIVQCTSYSFGQFIAGRFIAGFGNGFNTATVPAYQAECVKSHRKGTILMISAGAFVAFGLALSYWFCFGLAYVSNASAAWRIPIAVQIFFAIVAFCILIFLPESPRWLILTGREEEALTVLSAINNEDIQGPEIRDEFLQIKDAILVMSSGSTSSMRSNKEKRNLHRVVLAYFIQVFQQMSGINLILQYLALMFYNQTSYSGWVARLLAGLAATEYFLASFVAVVGIDRFWGRRSLMVFGASGMCLCMVLLTVLIYLWQVHSVGGTNIAATVFIFGFSTFFAIGWQGMAWLYQVEVVPLRIRGPANALSTSANWLFNSIVVFITPIAFHNISWKTYIIFACTNFTIVPLIYFFYPETAYRSLEEVDVLFYLANESPGNPWLNVVKIAREQPLWFGKNGEQEFEYEKSEWHRHYQQGMESGSTLTRGGERNGDNGEKHSSPESGESDVPIGKAISSPSSSDPQSSSMQSSSSDSRKRLNKDLAAHLGAHDDSNKRRPPKHPNTRRNKSVNSTKSDKSNYSTRSDTNWQDSDMVPPPLRANSRPTTAGSAKTAVSERAKEDAKMGITRTASGRETYLADGMEGVPARPDSAPRRLSFGSSGSWSWVGPREAGRGA